MNESKNGLLTEQKKEQTHYPNWKAGFLQEIII